MNRIKNKKELTDKKIMGLLKKHNNILKKYKVKRIGLFGSYVRGEQKRYSDIDFLVELEEPNVLFLQGDARATHFLREVLHLRQPILDA